MFFAYQQIINLLLQYRYFIFFPLVVIEGPITTIIVGFLSSSGIFNFWLAYILAVVADLLSDVGYYAFGRFGRKRIIERYGHYVGITIPRMEKIEGHFKNHGGKMLIFGKIADPLASLIQTTAGTTRMPFLKFLYYNIIATFPKSLILITVGFYFGEALNQVDFIRQIIGIVLSIVGIAVITAYIIYRRKKQKEIEAIENNI